MKKLLLAPIVVLLVILLFFFWRFWSPDLERLHPQLKWNIASPLSVEKSGHWTLTVDSEKQQLVVKSAKGVTWLTTTAGQAFVGGAFDTTTAHEHRGSFHFTHQIQPPCETQTVDTVDEQKHYAEVGGLLFCGGRDYPWSLRFYTRHPQSVRMQLSLDSRLKRSNLHIETHSDEKFFGGGAQFTHLSVKGHAIPMWVSEQGIGRGLQPLTFIMNLLARSGGHSYSTYFSSGAFISSKNRGLVIHSYPKTIVDFSEDDRVTVDHWSHEMELSFSHSDSIKELLKIQSQYTGRMRPLPDWFHKGGLLGVQGGQHVVLEKLEKVLHSGAQLSGLWIQDWVGQRKTSIGKQLWWDWNLDTTHYPDWPEFHQQVKDHGLQLLGYVNPMLVEIPGSTTNRRLLSEARRKGYLVKTHSGDPLEIGITSFSAELLDLTNANAADWFLQHMQQHFLNLGFKGWMADFGEALPTRVQLHNQEGDDFHNQYAESWIAWNRRLVESSDTPEDLVFFNRAGFTHSPAHSTLFWLGDQMVSWDGLDGLQSSLVALLSSGISGATLNHSDIGGYTSIDVPLVRFMRTEELLIRWMELNAFTVAFRSHEGNLPETSLQVFSNDRLLGAFAHFSKVFAELFEYRRQLVQEAAEHGLPVVRPLWLEFPGSPTAWEIDNQFMLGPDILVAPVLKPKMTTRRLWLPPGTWNHLFSDQSFEAPEGGLWLEMDAPLGQPPALVRSTSHWKDRWRFQPLK